MKSIRNMKDNFDERIIDDEKEFKKHFKKTERPEVFGKNRSPKVRKHRITISIDGDILEFFKERASENGKLRYQTQINNELRKAMENLKKPKSEVVTMEMLENPDFLSILAEKLKAA